MLEMLLKVFKGVSQLWGGGGFGLRLYKSGPFAGSGLDAKIPDPYLDLSGGG